MARPIDQLWTEPKICPQDPTPADMAKDWMIQFRFYDESKGKWKLIPVKKGINYHKKFKDRLAAANQLRDSLKEYLKNGWNPINGTMPVDKIINPLDNNVAKLPLSKALDHALKECKVTPGCFKEYRLTVNHLLPIMKSVTVPLQDGGDCQVDLSVVPVGEIKKYHIKLILEEARRQYKWTNNNWNKHLGNLQGVLSRLVDNDVFEHNPAHDIKRVDTPEPDKFQSLDEQTKRIIREDIYLLHYGYYVYLMTLYHTGLRPFEALAIRISDLRLQRRLIRVAPDEARQNSKTKKVREVPIPDELAGLLKQWVSGHDDTGMYLFGSPYTGGRGNQGSAKGGLRGALHPDYFKPSHTRIKRDTVTRLWKKVMRDKFGCDHYQYDLKGTGGDDKILAGVDLDALRDQYGHQNKRMSERYAKRIKEIYKKEIISKSPSF